MTQKDHSEELINKDIRFRLFQSYALICVILSLAFTVINAINKRPFINILTGIIMATVCAVIYWMSHHTKHKNVVRIMFLAMFTFAYVPLSYTTTPGTQSAMPYILILVIFILSIVAIKPWEYIFAVLVIVESVFLFRLEILRPELFDVYTDSVYRINDLSINFVVITSGIFLTIVFIMNQYAKYNKRLYDISIRDALTGLYNKRYFDDFARLEFERSKKNDLIFSLIFIDMNNFKLINDYQGHQKGDKVLKDVATIIQNQFLEGVCARYGGDEFIILIPEAVKQEIVESTKELETLISSYFMEYDDLDVSVAIGVADSKNKTLDEIILMADSLLYKDKMNKKMNQPELNIFSSDK